MGNYLYNGHKFPELPNWNREEYPYAVIVSEEYYYGIGYRLYTLDKPGYYGTCQFYEDNELYRLDVGLVLTSSDDIDSTDRFEGHLWQPNTKLGTWDIDRDISYPTIADSFYGGEDPIVETQFIWANYDILTENGAVYLAASEPEAVPDPVSPSDRLKVWLTGLAMGTLEKPPTTVRMKESDFNEWPIEWSYPDMLQNYKEEWPAAYEVKVSGYVPTIDECKQLVLDVTENGITNTYRYYRYDDNNREDVHSVSLVDAEGNYDSLTIVREPGENIGRELEQVGIYYIVRFDKTGETKYSLRLTTTEPISYSYNGVILPKLPEWDREVYPYAVMTKWTKEGSSGTSVGDISLCVCSYPLTFDGSNIVQSGAPERTKYLLYRYSPSNGDAVFVLKGEYSGGATNKVTYPSDEDAFWTNTDILNEDGTIYLAASEPTPVYE